MMKTGMLWRMGADDLIQAVSNAAQYYSLKYGATPDTCHVNPADLTDDIESAGGCKLVADRRIQRRHLWLGFDSKEKNL